MAGSHGESLKKFTDDAEIVPPPDYNKLVCRFEALEDVVNNISNTPIKHFFAYDAEGDDLVTSSWSDIPLDTEVTIDSDSFEHTGGTGEITIKLGDLYEIIGECGFKNDTSAVIEIRLVKKSVGDPSYVEIAGTRGYCVM